MKWTIHGLHPGLERSEVLRRAGKPRGDGTWGKVVIGLPAGSVMNWQDYPVWHYGQVAVVFRDHRVVQVLGNQLEENGKLVEGPLADLWERDTHGVLEPGECGPFRFRLFPPLRVSVTAPTPLLRNRMREILPDLTSARLVRFDLERGEGDRSLCEGWLTESEGGLRWTPLALRRSLWECLHYGDDYWRSGCQRRPTGHIIQTNAWDADPVHVRLRLLVDAEVRLAQRQGAIVPMKLALDEMGEAECAAAFQRLMLAGRSPEPGFWHGAGELGHSVRLVEDNQATDSLRWAAAHAQLLDHSFGSHPFLYPGPPDSNFEMGTALAGRRGKSGWSWKGAAADDVRLDWSDPRHRFHALWTPSGAVLKPFDRDRLGEVQEAARLFAQTGHTSAEDWSEKWVADLPRDDIERELLRQIERMPYFDRPVHHLANSLRQLAKLSRSWLPTEPSSGQRYLAEGLFRTIRFGLDVLGCEYDGRSGD